jgi:hypothetical protein
MPNSTEKGLRELKELGTEHHRWRDLYFACKSSRNTDSKECQDYVYQIVQNERAANFMAGISFGSRKPHDLPEEKHI